MKNEEYIFLSVIAISFIFIFPYFIITKELEC